MSAPHLNGATVMHHELDEGRFAVRGLRRHRWLEIWGPNMGPLSGDPNMGPPIRGGLIWAPNMGPLDGAL